MKLTLLSSRVRARFFFDCFTPTTLTTTAAISSPFPLPVKQQITLGAEKIGPYIGENCPFENLAPYPYINETMGELQRIQVGPVEYGYYLFGEKDSELPPLVFIMGWTGTIQQWVPPMLKAAADAREVLVFDNRGIGESFDANEANNGTITIKGMAESTLDLVNSLNLATPDIFGWSMGGEIGLTMAALYPDKISKVISLAGDLGGPNIAIENEPQYEYVDDVLANPSQDPKASAAKLAALFPAYLNNTEKPLESACTFIRSFVSLPGDPATGQNITYQSLGENAFMNETYTYDGISKSTTPILLITGAEDVVAPYPQVFDATMRRVPAGTLGVVLPNTGHGAMYTYPELITELTNAFSKADADDALEAVKKVTDTLPGSVVKVAGGDSPAPPPPSGSVRSKAMVLGLVFCAFGSFLFK
jgi:pimeloyl-ACP methyl ester carboxylesterase